MKTKVKSSSGITLIALVVTIIVCAILIGVSLYNTTGKNGILAEARNAKKEALKSQASEELDLVLVKVISKINTKRLKNYEICEELEKQLKNYDETVTVEIDGTGYSVTHRGFVFKLNEYCDKIDEGSTEDIVVAKESAFVWEGDEIVGYKPTIREYSVLVFPNRCIAIQYPSETVDSTVGSSSSSSSTESGSSSTSSGSTSSDSSVTSSGSSSGTGSSGEIVTYFDYVKEIRIPKTVESIKTSAFARVFRNLTKVQIIGETSIGTTAFAYCTNLKEISMPKVTVIGYSAFSGCSSLTEVDLVDVVTIAELAFENCTSLKSITLSENVQSIGTNAFSNISSTATFHVVEGSYADIWLQSNKLATQTIKYK